jgi:hypothetical protein
MPRDYLLRLVEQMAQMIGSLIVKRQAGLHEEAKRDLEALCLEHIGLSLDSVRRASPEALKATLASGGALEHARAIGLAELLILDADLCVDSHQPAHASISRLHAFCLLDDHFDLLSREEQVVYRKKLDQLAQSLEALRRDPYVDGKLRRYEAKRPSVSRT